MHYKRGKWNKCKIKKNVFYILSNLEMLMASLKINSGSFPKISKHFFLVFTQFFDKEEGGVKGLLEGQIKNNVLEFIKK